jgi:hypothetical protein
MGVVDLSTELVADVAGSALQAQGIPFGSDVIEPLLKKLLNVQDEQAEAITRIDANVQRLIDGPWETARSYIEEASLAVVTPEEREDKLKSASAELHRAIPLQPEDSLQRAYACINLALVERMLGDALRAATAYILEELEAVKAGRKELRHSPVSVTGPLIGGTRAYLKLRALDHHLPFIWQQFTEIRDAATALCGEGDEDVHQCREQLDARIMKLKLAKVVAKLTASTG